MTVSLTILRTVQVIAALACLATGWLVTIQQAGDVGFGFSGTVWLLVLSLLATAGAIVFLTRLKKPPSAVSALALAVVILSPTGFAYPINAVVLVLAAFEATLAWRRRRDPQP